MITATPLANALEVSGQVRCDCGGLAFEVGISLPGGGNNFIRVLECAVCRKQMPVPVIHQSGVAPAAPAAGTRPAAPRHEVVYAELVALLDRHTGDLSALEVLAVAANMVGKIAAMQDQRRGSPEEAMETVAHNIEIGYQQGFAQLAAVAGEA